MAEPRQKSVSVVVLGDIGRSPRMQYHALSLANHGLRVNIIGYMDSNPLTEILEHPKITISKLQPLVLNKGPKLFQYALKAFWQGLSLFFTLLVSGKCNYVLCQNPPAIPTLPVCKLYCILTGTVLVVDWHNYAYSIMALSLPSGNLLLTFSKLIERTFGQMSNHNFCVTYAMQKDLLSNWNIKAKVLYDRPPKIFHPLSLDEKHTWFLKIGVQYPEFRCPGREQLNQPWGGCVKTAFTQLDGREVVLRGDRPGLLFSSTSWTPDEDFSILMEALLEYETAFEESKNLPKLVCVITGKGPMKQHYMDLIKSKKWKHVKVVTPWLEARDYPMMVGSADLGVCLHTSSSGLDLPMKVVDMFGAGLPVCAFDFKCLDELVEVGINGYTFKNSSELAQQIITWFKDFPNNETQNRIAENMKKHLVKFQDNKWEDNWELRAKEIFVS